MQYEQIIGVSLGLAAALGFGIADFLAAVMSRRLGSLGTAIGMQVAGALFLLVAAFWLWPEFAWPSSSAIAGLVAVGCLQAIGYVSFYKGLATGTVSIVSPIVASWAVIPILVGLLLFGEYLQTAQAMGVGLILAGVTVASTGRERLESRGRVVAVRGMSYALMATLGLGISMTLLVPLSLEVGWFLPVLIARIVSLATLLVFALARARPTIRRPSFPRLPALALAGLAVIGLIDSLAFLAFVQGVRVEQVSLLAPVSSAFPLVTIILARIFFAERLGRWQTWGVLTVLVGLVLVAV